MQKKFWHSLVSGWNITARVKKYANAALDLKEWIWI